MNKILTLLFLLFISYSGTYSQFRKLEKKHHSVNKLLKEILAESDFKNADVGFYAIDNNSGEIITSYHAEKSFLPASTQKLVTTATALEFLSPDFQFKTTVQYSGYIDTVKHILHGNIIIKGGGDPTLGSKYFDETKNAQFLSSWINEIKKLHIDSVAGAVIADATIYDYDIVPITWSWNNMGNYFGAGANGLSVFDNYYTIYFNSSDSIGKIPEIVKIEPNIPDFIFDNQVESDSVKYDNVYIYGAPYSDIRYLRGEIPLSKSNFGVKGSMPDPAYFCAYILEQKLKNKGIRFKEKATTLRLSGNRISDRTTITTTKSPKLSEIIKQTNTHSINLFAEHLLKQIGFKLFETTETENVVKLIVKFWKEKGIDVQGMYLYDGSGLSRHNGITPVQMVSILTYMKNSSPYFNDFYNSLPVAGETGTLKKMFKEKISKGSLRAKSGTVDRVKAYAGYVTSVSKRDIIFSMVINDFSCSTRKAKAELERLMNALAEFDK